MHRSARLSRHDGPDGRPLDPWFMDMMSDVQILLRRVFQTDNRITYPLSASGSGGIEAAVTNPLEAGDDASSA